LDPRAIGIGTDLVYSLRVMFQHSGQLFLFAAPSSALRALLLLP
jgi:hypothetical protein